MDLCEIGRGKWGGGGVSEKWRVTSEEDFVLKYNTSKTQDASS